MKKLTKGKMWAFAIGQFGWSLLSATGKGDLWRRDHHRRDQCSGQDL